jgi:excisionase family DNA binding protein
LTVKEAAARAKCGEKMIYRAVKNRRLKAARVDGRNTLRFLAEWIDDWLRSSVTIH